jgi:hypothetical protein
VAAYYGDKATKRGVAAYARADRAFRRHLAAEEREEKRWNQNDDAAGEHVDEN